MAQHIKIPETKIITKNGETTLSIILDPIVIEVNVNINHDGSLNVQSLNTQNKEDKPEEKLEDKINWAIPTFGNQSQKIKFGK